MQNASPAPQQSAEDEIDLGALIATVVAGKWWILAATVLGLSASGFYAYVAPRIYQADALIQVETENKGNAALGDMAELLGGKAPVTGEIEIVKSRMVLGQVVDKLGLTIIAMPSYAPLIGQAMARGFTPTQSTPLAPSRFGLQSYAWGGERLKVTRLEVPESLLNTPFTLVSGGNGTYQLLAANGERLGEGKAGLASQFATPEGFINLFVQELHAHPKTQFNLQALRRADEVTRIAAQLKVSEKGKQSGILSLSYSGTNPDLVRSTLQAVAVTYQRQNVERKSAEAQATLTFLEAQLPELRKSLERSEDELNAFRLRAGSVDLTKETEIVLEESVVLEQSRLALEQKRREALQRFTANHPSVQTIDAQIAQLSGKLGRIVGQTKNLPETQQELLRLTRDMKVNTDLYTNLLNNSQQLQVVRAGTVGNVRIIDAAEKPLKPIKPKIPLILTLGMLLGAMVGLALVFIRRALNAGVYDSAIVEAATGIPTYATIPFAKGQAVLDKQRKGGTLKEGLLAVVSPQDVTVEALRSLRTALHFAQIDSRNNIVMLTGPSPGLGKSFVSLNLAAVLAATGKRVVVVDADMRRGHMHESLGEQRAPGLSDVISGSVSLQQALRQIGNNGLQFIATGTIPPNPAELLLNEHFAKLLDQLSEHFDTVIIDTPPVLAVTDATIVGRLAGATLLVLKTGEHPLRMIEDTVRRLSNAGVQVRGTIFNQTQQSAEYYRGRAGYKYGYYNYEYGK